jgi:ATP-dependent Clp protease, protease subunit
MNGRYVLPSFVERTSYGVKETNPYSRLFEDRIIFLGTPIDDTAANDIVAQLLALEAMDPDRDISLYINSPGGSLSAMTAVYDTMCYVKPGILRVRAQLEEILSRPTGRSPEQVEATSNGTCSSPPSRPGSTA